MVTIGISEFTFGYAFLHEQTINHEHDLIAAPILPSLQEEANVGWDARLPTHGTDFYFQFKLSDYLSRSNATFIRNGSYQRSYYRIALHRNNSNRQHQRLKELSINNPNTFYVVPEFNHIDEFNAAFLNRQIISQSRLIPLADCEEIADNQQHYITFQQGDENWILHSEKKMHKKSMFGKNILTIYKESKPSWKTLDKNYAIDLYDKTSEKISKAIDKEDRTIDKKNFKLLQFNPQRATKPEILIQTSQILSMFFGVILVLVGN
jgi:hypothetical protein